MNMQKAEERGEAQTNISRQNNAVLSTATFVVVH
jgi:hypothetical protein